MKNWKQGIFGILAVTVLALAVTACGEKETEPTADNTITLTGERLVGGTLTATVGTGNGTGTPTFTINGTNGNTYTVTFADVGNTLKVTATFSNGKVEYTTEAIPTPTLTVQLTGMETDGTVFADETTLTITATKVNVATAYNPPITYSWKTGNNTIENETSTTLDVIEEHFGETITGTANFTGYSFGGNATTSAVAGYLVEISPGTKIPVYKDASVVQASVNAFANIQSGYDMLGTARKGMLLGKIQELRIVTTESSYEKVGDKYVIRINIDNSDEDIGDYLYSIAPSLN